MRESSATAGAIAAPAWDTGIPVSQKASLTSACNEEAACMTNRRSGAAVSLAASSCGKPQAVTRICTPSAAARNDSGVNRSFGSISRTSPSAARARLVSGGKKAPASAAGTLSRMRVRPDGAEWPRPADAAPIDWLMWRKLARLRYFCQ